MADPIIQGYLSDPTIEMSKRQGVLKALKAGQSEQQLSQMIYQKYPDKFAKVQVQKAVDMTAGHPAPKPPQDNSVLGGLLGGGLLGGQNKSTPVGNFIQNKALPQIQDSLSREGLAPSQFKKMRDPLTGWKDPNAQTGDNAYNVGKQAVEGIGNTLAGVGKVAYAPLSPLNPLDTRTMEQKSETGIEGLNQIIGGVGQTVTSPLAASPTAQTLVSLPFEALHDTLSGAFTKMGVDTESQHGKNIVDSAFNGILLAVGGGKDIVEKVKTGELTPKAAWEQVKQTPKMAKEIPGMAKETIVDTFSKAQPKDTSGIVGQILQGKIKDIEAGKRALGNIDASGIKSYEDLSNAFGNKINEVKSALDEHLQATPEARKLKEYETEIKVGDKSRKLNYVKAALDQLKELYDSISDPENSLRIESIIDKAKKDGLSLKEANDISREYGTEFGSKAFGKNGEALTSVNARAYENVRKGVKESVRSKTPGNMAANLDKQMSDMIKTKELVDKAKEKANALLQRVKQKGVGAKIGGAVATVADIASGGILKGFVEKLIPRNMELKTLNYLDLQKQLPDMLKKLDDFEARSIKAKTATEKAAIDKEILDFLALPSAGQMPTQKPPQQ